MALKNMIHWNDFTADEIQEIETLLAPEITERALESGLTRLHDAGNH